MTWSLFAGSISPVTRFRKRLNSPPTNYQRVVLARSSRKLCASVFGPVEDAP